MIVRARVAALVVGAVLLLTSTPVVSAAPVEPGYVPFGNATVDSGGATLTSTSQPDETAAGGLLFTLPFGSITYGDLVYLGTEYEVLVGHCGGGSPRFVLSTPGGNIFVYLGTPPNFTDCGAVTGDTGNILTTGDPRCDTRQVGGSVYDSCDNIPAETVIDAIYLVVDGGWSQLDGVQSFRVDPTVIINVEAVDVDVLCVSRMTGAVRAPEDGNCTQLETLVEPDNQTSFCINQVTRSIRVAPGDCTRYEVTHSLSGDGGLWACRNAVTGSLRATTDFDGCSRYETAVYIAAPVV